MNEIDQELLFNFKSECEKDGIYMSDEAYLEAFKECQFFEKHGIGRLEGIIQMSKRLKHFINELVAPLDNK